MREVVYSASKDDFVLEIVYDGCCESPREWDNLGKMVCFHGRYTLGDEHDYSGPKDFLLSLLLEHENELLAGACPDVLSRLFYYWKNHDGANDALCLELLNMAEELTHSQLGDSFPADKLGQVIAKDDPAWLWEMVEEELSSGEFLGIVEALDKYVILPLYLYDHGGITMSTGAFSCPWDSGRVGWIYAEKKKLIEETGYTEAELFSTDPHRVPVIGERVKVEGRDDWGEVTENVIALDGSPGYMINFDYNKYLGARKPENLVIVPQHEITEVMSNRAVSMLVGEVETYDLYLRGECYGYRLCELETCEHCGAVKEEEVDSCWGFFADTLADLKEQIKDYVPSEFHDLVDSLEYTR